jgi:hypothetical protein
MLSSDKNSLHDSKVGATVDQPLADSHKDDNSSETDLHVSNHPNFLTSVDDGVVD